MPICLHLCYPRSFWSDVKYQCHSSPSGQSSKSISTVVLMTVIPMLRNACLPANKDAVSLKNKVVSFGLLGKISWESKISVYSSSYPVQRTARALLECWLYWQHYHTMKYHNVSHNVEQTFWGKKRKLQAQWLTDVQDYSSKLKHAPS